MRLTEKDQAVMNEIGRWGYLTADETQLLTGEAAYSFVSRRLKRLFDNGYVKREKIYTGEYVYYLKNLREINFVNFKHEHKTKELALFLKNKLKCEYFTPKELRGQIRGKESIKTINPKIPDLILIKNNQKIAVEVELHQKDFQRQRENIAKYKTSLATGEFVNVVYYCSTEAIKTRIDKLAVELNVKVATNLIDL